ncbi:hypothetical protein G9A89_018208 [Geosiphon pyriformis]|nr:hypothetical protein G9A89_018208 [Geosiphon pyriformis]
MTARLNPATTLRKKLGKLLENISTIDTIESLSIIQRTQPKPSDTVSSEQPQWKTSTDNTKPKVAESENIGANHLGFAKFLFQHYCQYLGLNHNHISTESAFNFYINEKIFSLLETPVNTESARETFYKELIQNTNLLTNHNFASIITKINKKIEHHTQQRYPITYASKGKGKLQTPAVTPRKLQPPAWKKNRVESPSNPSYHSTLGSTINILSTNAQKKTELLGPYAAESEKEEEESEDQEFTYQNLITKTLEVETPNLQTQQDLNIENSEIETLNQQRQNNLKPKLINQQNLPPIIVIDQPLINPPPQLSNLDPIVYAPIAKLDNFTGEEDDAQSLVNKPQDFNAFKAEFLRYFSNNNSINYLVNTFTTMKQGETEAVTTYLGRFHRNLRQIQAIDDNYFTAPQIFNQFIHGLCSSILQHVHPLYSGTLQDAVTHARDFESTESETNHAQAVNLVMNGSSELDSKLEKFSESINKRLKKYLADNHTIYQSPQRRNNQGHPNRGQNQPYLSSLTNQ